MGARLRLSFARKDLHVRYAGIAEKIGADVIAEGIERVEELETLIELGIPYGQGFLFARPTPGFVRLKTIQYRTVNEVPGLIVD